MSKRKPLPADDVAPAIARMRQIAAEAGDHLLLADGPPHPDAELLDLCAIAVHHLRPAQRAWDMRREAIGRGMAGDPEGWEEDNRLLSSFQAGEAAGKPSLARITKLKAKTAAGIYAKALVVRASKTGAANLAMSLAEDFLAIPALRASLWPAEEA